MVIPTKKEKEMKERPRTPIFEEHAKAMSSIHSTLGQMRTTPIIEEMDDEPKPHSIVTKCAAEFLCCLIFIFVGSMQAQAVGNHDGVLHAALTHGICIFILASAFGGISGGHINPAITLGIALVGKISPVHAVCYIASQLSGGFVGALLVKLVLNSDKYIAIQGGATLVAPNVAVYQALIAEIITAFMLVQSVLLTAVDTSSNVLAALAIGFTIIVDIFAVGNISGASMNPARSFGPNLAGTIFIDGKRLQNNFWANHWIYYIGPFLGAALAAGLYKTFFARSKRVVA